jgi:tetratricopeptide (TPR) repeat protein
VALAEPTKKSDGCLKDPECNEHYQRALAEYDAGRYDTALAGFQAAYARRQMPWLLVNIGRTVQRLGRPQEAINYYERYKKAEPNIDAEAEKRINKYIEQARALLESTPEQPTLPLTPPKPDPTTTPPALNLNATAPTPPPPSDAPAGRPVYKKWWFWTIIGVVVAGGVAGGVAGAVLANKKQPVPDPIQPTDPVYTPTF